MKGKWYIEQQILSILEPIDAGQPLAEITWLHGITVSTLHRWKAKYSGMTKNETRRFYLLEEENRHLKKLVTDLSLDDQVLKEVVAKKW
ncbi:transposase [Deinococcus arenicola]|uniref:Transposase n=1 Tax=Deinococcus arenicola TaxID=2994950 RepID=A0ABU4DST0_9DEIO|nr:transposase [Deinococcus sp. ZS9-10]MDV6375492.1 transposase [Deinococcus sp. ZS9-10]